MAARISITSQALNYPGLLPVLAGPPTSDGDVVDSGRSVLWVVNGGGSTITVTISTPNTIDGDLAIADRVISVPVGTVPTVIPLNSPNYKQTTASAVLPADVGRVYVNYSAVTSVTRGVINHP